MANDRAVMRGINTDAPPDRIGDQAWDLCNVIPRSPISVMPRPGVSLVANLQPSVIGINVVATALPFNEGGGVLISLVNTNLVDGNVVNRVEHVRDVIYSRTPETLLTLNDIYSDAVLRMIIYGAAGEDDYTPSVFDYVTGDIDPMAGSTQDIAAQVQNIVGCVYLRSGTVISTFTGPDFDIVNSYTLTLGGLAVVYQRYISGISAFLEVEYFDIATGDNVLEELGESLWWRQIANISNSTNSPQHSLYSNAVSMPSPRVGVLAWHSMDFLETTNSVYSAVSMIGVAGDDRHPDWISKVMPNPAQGFPCDINPIPRTSRLLFLYGVANTASNAQLYIYELIEPGDNNVPPSYTTATVYSNNYGSSAWPDWNARPDTFLAVQYILSKTVNAIAVLAGDWIASPTIHPAIENPRLALLNPPDQSFFDSNGAFTGGEVIYSHEENATYHAHGMCVDQDGFVYMTGTGDFIADEATYLILKYDPKDLSTPVARVAHLDDGLGDGYADPLDTHIITPAVDGNRIVVQDHGPVNTRIFTYDLDLNFIKKTTVSTAVMAFGTRVRMNRNTTQFVAKFY